MDFLSQDDERVSKLKKKIFGGSSFIHTDDRYDEIGMLVDLNIDLPIWKTYTIREKAMVKARYYLNNMAQVINSYYDERDRMIDNAKNKVAN